MAEYTGTDNLEVMAEAVNYNRFLEDLVAKHHQVGDRVVDFGAGIGTFALALRNRGITPVCVETDNSQLAITREHGFEGVSASSELADQSVDYIYSLNVLEHIEDDVAALRELHRVLKRDGRVFIYVPAFQILFSSMDEKVGHFRRYTRSSLKQAAEQAGFKVEQCSYADSLGYLATIAFKLVGSDSGDINIGALKFYDRRLFPLSRLMDLVLRRVLGKNVYAVLHR